MNQSRNAGWTTAFRQISVPLVVAYSATRRVALLVVLAAGACPQDCPATTIESIISFDSSLSDTGNSPWLGPPYAEGRATNGLVWVEQLASKLGVPVPVASELGGTNYAWGGAKSGPGLHNLEWQIDQYLSGHSPHASQLFVMSGGQNNFYSGQFDPPLLASYMAGHIAALANAGASNFLILNILPLGEVPVAIGEPELIRYLLNEYTVEYNTLLAAELDNLRNTRPINIMLLDWFSLAQQIMGDPASFGLTNVTDPAYDFVKVVPNPEEYMFWDPVHPTTVTHGILADAAVSLIEQSINAETWIVPEPTAIVLMGAGLMMVSWCVRRRKK